MTTHALPATIELTSVTAMLRSAGMLPEGQVTSVRSVHSFPTVLSRLHRLKLECEGAADGAPRHLYLKTGQPDGPIIQGDAHVWNCFLPKEGSDTPRLFDWDGWQPNVGADDLGCRELLD